MMKKYAVLFLGVVLFSAPAMANSIARPVPHRVHTINQVGHVGHARSVEHIHHGGAHPVPVTYVADRPEAKHPVRHRHGRAYRRMSVIVPLTLLTLAMID